MPKTETISIKPIAMRIPDIIQFYEGLNDVGKAGFILTLQEKDRQPFLDAYEEHYYKNNPDNTPKSKLSSTLFKETT